MIDVLSGVPAWVLVLTFFASSFALTLVHAHDALKATGPPDSDGARSPAE
jgi:hypothetical protein